jgi:hypothetical protein
MRIDNCEPRFEAGCPKHWDALTLTADQDVRSCETCGEQVFMCRTVFEAPGRRRQGQRLVVHVQAKLDLVPRPCAGRDPGPHIFTAVAGDGSRHTVIIVTRFQEGLTPTGHRMARITGLITTQGRRLTRLEKGRYQDLDSGMTYASDDPHAP